MEKQRKSRRAKQKKKQPNHSSFDDREQRRRNQEYWASPEYQDYLSKKFEEEDRMDLMAYQENQSELKHRFALFDPHVTLSPSLGHDGCSMFIDNTPYRRDPNLFDIDDSNYPTFSASYVPDKYTEYFGDDVFEDDEPEDCEDYFQHAYSENPVLVSEDDDDDGDDEDEV